MHKANLDRWGVVSGNKTGRWGQDRGTGVQGRTTIYSLHAPATGTSTYHRDMPRVDHSCAPHLAPHCHHPTIPAPPWPLPARHTSGRCSQPAHAPIPCTQLCVPYLCGSWTSLHRDSIYLPASSDTPGSRCGADELECLGSKAGFNSSSRDSQWWQTLTATTERSPCCGACQASPATTPPKPTECPGAAGPTVRTMAQTATGAWTRRSQGTHHSPNKILWRATRN